MPEHFKVQLSPYATQDIEAAYLYAAQHAPEVAVRWVNRLEVGIKSLGHNPQRGALSAENSLSPVELRDYLFGQRPNVFRVIYTIREEVVLVLRVRRGQRKLAHPGNAFLR